MNRRSLIIGLAILQVAVFGALLYWHLGSQQRAGWAGFGYTAGATADAPRSGPGAALAALAGFPGRVVAVVPGSPADRAGVRKGDVVRTVNDVALHDTGALLALSRAARRGDEVTYALERGGEQLQVSLRLVSPFAFPAVTAGVVTSVLSGFAFVLISLLVLGARPDSRAAKVFFLLCTVGGAMYFMWAGSEAQIPDTRGVAAMSADPFWLIILIVFGLFSGVVANLLLHLALVFPRPRPVVQRWPGILGWVHLGPALPLVWLLGIVAGIELSSAAWGGAVLVAGLASALAGPGRRMWRTARRAGVLRSVADHPLAATTASLAMVATAAPALRLLPSGWARAAGVLVGAGLVVGFLIYAVAYSVLTCIALVRSYRESGVEERRQLWWPIWGTTTALAGSLLVGVGIWLWVTVFPAASAKGPMVAILAATAPKLLTLLIPVSFAFGIVKHRLMDIEILVRKTVVYGAVTGGVVAAYLVLAGVAGLTLVRWAGVHSQVATVLTTLAAVALLVPIRNRVQSFVDRRFFQRERRRDQAGQRIAALAGNAISLEVLFPLLAEEVQQALHSRSALVLHRHRGSDLILPGASIGVSDSVRARIRLSLDSPLLNRDSLPPASPDRPPWAALSAPARLAGEPVGLLAAGPPLAPEPYGPEDETFLAAAAAQLAMAVANLQGREAEREFAQARVIQQGLLPATLPAVAGFEVAATWHPSQEVAGDYYDVLALDGQRLAVCVGDVSGKGMAAALLMSSLQAALRAVAGQGVGPAAICTQVRTVVCRSLSGGRFVTFFLAVLDRQAGTVTYSNAGHVPALLVRPGGSAERLVAGGPAMARVLEELPYQQDTVPLHDGDRLVLVSDGVTEAAREDGALFGEERLLDLVTARRGDSAGGLLQAILHDVREFSGDRLADDLTLVVVGA